MPLKLSYVTSTYFTISSPNGPHGLALNPNQTFAYILDQAGNIRKVDLLVNNAATTILSQNIGNCYAITATPTTLYYSSWNNINKFNLATLTSAPIALSPPPTGTF